MKSEDEQMIQRIMDTDTMGYAIINWSRMQKRQENDCIIAVNNERIKEVKKYV